MGQLGKITVDRVIKGKTGDGDIGSMDLIAGG